MRVREEVELRRIVESFLRHASCRFNRDSPHLRTGPRSRRSREVDAQLAQPPQIERRADLRQFATLDDDLLFLGVDLLQHQLGYFFQNLE